MDRFHENRTNMAYSSGAAGPVNGPDRLWNCNRALLAGPDRQLASVGTDGRLCCLGAYLASPLGAIPHMDGNRQLALSGTADVLMPFRHHAGIT